MRIGVVDHVSAGGVSRFAANLIDRLVARDDVTAVHYYVSAFNVTRDSLDERWSQQPKVVLKPITGAMDNMWAIQATALGTAARSASGVLARLPKVHSAARAAYRWLLRTRGFKSGPWYEYRLDPAIVEELHQLDVTYLAWPFFIEPFETGGPVVATFHDFHFEHFPAAYADDQLTLARRQTEDWLARVSVAVTSTEFVSSEIDRFRTTRPKHRDVVYLAAYTNADPDASPDESVLRGVGAVTPYIIYSGGGSKHKNVLAIFKALESIRQRRGSAPLFILTGLGMDQVGQGTAGPDNSISELDRFIRENSLERGTHYLPLGYVPEHTVDELTRAANLVISASLYEAGCGPALDAWQLGAPVALSSIPPFLEQLDRFGVEAYAFDPTDPEDIARAIEGAMDDPEAAKAAALRSQQKMRAYTWDNVADGYARAFARAIEMDEKSEIRAGD